MSHNKQTKKAHFSTQHIITVFLVYAVVIFVILALINYMVFPLMYVMSLLGVSIVLAAVATFLHTRKGIRSGVDDIADNIRR